MKPPCYHPVLSKVFPDIMCLSDYISHECSILEESPTSMLRLIRDGDSSAYKKLLLDGRVCMLTHVDEEAKHAAYAVPDSDSKTMQLVVSKLLEDAFRIDQVSVLRFGYSYLGLSADTGMEMNPSIDNEAVNSIHMHLMQEPWATLLSRVHIGIICTMLLHTYVFAPLDNNCFLQLSGVSMKKLLPRTMQPSENKRSQSTGALLDFNRQFIETGHMFYNDNVYTTYGLPLHHVLNRVTPTKTGSRSILSVVFSLDASGKRFKRIMNMNETHQDMKSRMKMLQKRYETLIAPKQLPKRLIPLELIFFTLLKRHKTCRYRIIMDELCSNPLEVKLDDIKVSCHKAEKQTNHMFTQLPSSSDSEDNEIAVIPNVPNTTTDTSYTLAQLVEMHTPLEQVNKFLQTVMTHLFPPKHTWGSDHNCKLFQSKLRRFITMRHGEMTNLHQLLQGFRLSDIPWFKCKGDKPGNRPHNLYIKQMDMLAKILFFIFNDIIVSLVNVHFYVTDTEIHKFKIYYYRKNIWNALQNAAVRNDSALSLHFKELSLLDLSYLLNEPRRKLGISQMRLKPKATSVRPIINMRSSSSRPIIGATSKNSFWSKRKEDQFSPINQMMSTTFDALTAHTKHTEELLGSSDMGEDDVYKRYKEFIKIWKGTHKCSNCKRGFLQHHIFQGKNNASLFPICSSRNCNIQLFPPLYIVSVDITKCFDMIERDELFKMVEGILMSESSYRIEKYLLQFTHERKVRLKTNRLITVESKHIDMCDHLSIESKDKRNIIFGTIDNNESKNGMKQRLRVKADYLMGLFHEHLYENIMQLGGRYFIQTKGIPQGSILSALLAQIFLGFIENNFIEKKLNKSSSSSSSSNQSIQDKKYLLMRHVDDFLFISDEKIKAETFLNTMHNGFAKYGVTVNASKTRTNFASSVLTDPTQNVLYESEGEGVTFIPWNGYLINVRTLEIQIDFERLLCTNFRDHFRIRSLVNPGIEFAQSFMRTIQARTKLILFDLAINSPLTVAVNIFQIFLIAGARLHLTLKSLSSEPDGSSLKHHNPKFIMSALDDGVNYFLALVRFPIDTKKKKYISVQSKRRKLTTSNINNQSNEMKEKDKKQPPFSWVWPVSSPYISKNPFSQFQIRWICYQSLLFLFKRKHYSHKTLLNLLNERIDTLRRDHIRQSESSKVYINPLANELSLAGSVDTANETMGSKKDRKRMISEHRTTRETQHIMRLMPEVIARTEHLVKDINF